MTARLHDFLRWGDGFYPVAIFLLLVILLLVLPGLMVVLGAKEPRPESPSERKHRIDAEAARSRPVSSARKSGRVAS